MSCSHQYTAIDLFSGCGGLSCGLEQAGFSVVASVEIDAIAAETYKLNHPGTKIIQADIKKVDPRALLRDLNVGSLDLLAGCPPCQGFSTLRRRNKRGARRDQRNSLIMEYLRFVKELEPKTILLENVPGLQDYYKFPTFVASLKGMGYQVVYETLNAENYGVPQRRKRLVLLGSRVGAPSLPQKNDKRVTVREAIGALPDASNASDEIHRMYSRHSDRIKKIIESIPKDGGSRCDIPSDCQLACHAKEGVGFSDVYGRMAWDDVAPTITGGCLNPSKGRFLHPVENRSITAREASLLQTFPDNYTFPPNISKQAVALMIGNALPPAFACQQARALVEVLDAQAPSGQA